MKTALEIKSTPETAILAAPEEKNEPPMEIYIDPAKEKAIMRKFDLFAMPQFVIIVILAYLDRTNIGNGVPASNNLARLLTLIAGNARIFGFEEDLGLQGNDFANISSFFFVTYVIFEVPWVLAVKKWGANSVVAVAIVSWSAITLGIGFVHNYGQCVALRFLLGAAEAGIFPALTFVVSTIYPRASQAKRVAVLYGASAIAGAFGGLIAYGIQLMGHRHGLEAWRWLFIVEGIISMVLGILCWASLPKTAENAWFLKAEEKQLMIDRRQRDFAYKGDSKLSWEDARMAFTDPMVITAGLTLFCAGIPLFGFGTFLPTIIRGLGFEDLKVNYMTIPVYIFGCLYLGTISYISDRLRKRAVVAITAPWTVIFGYAIVVGTSNVGGGYFAMFMVAGCYSFNALLLAWVSNNISPDSKRSAAIPWFICIGNCSGVAASQVYPNYTGPRFVMGNAISLAMEFCAVLGICVIYIILKQRNARKAKQRAEGIVDNGEKGDKALDFEYIF